MPVIADVAQATQSGAWGGYEFAVSDEGSVVYRPAASAAIRRVLVWVDRNGREEALPHGGTATNTLASRPTANAWLLIYAIS